MKTLLPLLAVSVLLAYFSQVNSGRCMAKNREYRAINDPAYVLLVVILILFSGLRTSYNDTFNYMNGYRKAPELAEFLSTLNFRMIFTNPLFNFYESTLKTLTDNPQWLIFTSSVFTQICFVRFIKRYSSDFTISIFIYFTLGTFVFTLAAIKQVLAMAVLTLSIPALEKRQWLKFYVLVFVAMLIHTYALAFAVLPLFRSKPWSLFTFVFIVVLTAVMMNFEQAITSFMEQANDLGKSLAEYEVFDDATINVFRLAVYSVPPLISLVCRKWVLHNSREIDNVLVHMSIISLAFIFQIPNDRKHRK